MDTAKAGISSGRKREFLIFCILSGIAFAVLGSLFFFFAKREESWRSVDLEFRAWQNSSAVMEYIESGEDIEAQLPFGVTAFGLYDDAGKAVRKSPGAPDSLDLGGTNGESIRVEAGSVKLTRRLAQPGPGMGMGLGMGMLQGRNRPDRGFPGRQNIPGAAAPGSAAGQGRAGGMMAPDPGRRRERILYVEFSSGDFERREAFYRIGSVAVLLAICGLYVFLLWLYRRTLVLADKEEKNRELVQLGEAARTIAHEIKNPLSVIRLQCVTLGKLLPEERRANLGVIEEETDRLAALTDKIGDFLRSQRGTPERLDLVPWSKSFAERNGLGWSSEAKGPCAVHIDPSRLESVMGNLASNAREASPEGRGVEIRLALEGGKARLDVLDRGSGVPPELARRIFDPFFTTKSRGSGIGLPLARKFAHEAGGGLEYRRREGGGSQFSLFLPLARP